MTNYSSTLPSAIEIGLSKSGPLHLTQVAMCAMGLHLGKRGLFKCVSCHAPISSVVDPDSIKEIKNEDGSGSKEYFLVQL